MTTDYRTLSCLVHAASKAGKTTMASTAPLPILALDVEGGWKWIPDSPVMVQMYGRSLRVRYWDPMREPPPRYDGTWEICIVIVRDWVTVQRTYDWLSYGAHDFVTIVVDSITEMQRRCKAQLVGSEAMKMQDWGVLLNYMDAIIRGFRDLTLVATQPVRVVVFIAETRQGKDGKWRPYMQGQVEVSLPYWMDVVGYLFAEPTMDGNGQMTGVARRLLVTPHPLYEAGERVQGRLGTVVDFPNISVMLKHIYPETEAAA